MSNLSLRQYLQAKQYDSTQGIRYIFRSRNISSLRLLLFDGHEVQGVIYKEWESLGLGMGKLGFPIDSRQVLNSNYPEIQGQRFENGTITDLGYGTVSAALNDGTSLPEIPYKLTLEKFRCEKRTTGEPGDEDEMWIRLIVSNQSLNGQNEMFKVYDYRNEHVRPHSDYPINLTLYQGKLPEIMQLSYMALEVDLDAAADNTLAIFTDKIKTDAEKWFSSELPNFESALRLIIAGNSMICIPLCALGGPYSAIIGTIAGGVLDGVLVVTIDWNRAELIGADRIDCLGPVLRDQNLTTLPTGSASYEVVYGATLNEEIKEKVTVSYSRYDNGDIGEHRRYSGTDAEVDYTFTFRHSICNRTGPKPNPPYGLSGYTLSYRSFKPDVEPKSEHFLGAESHIFWMVSSLGDTGYEIERLTKHDSKFVMVAWVAAHNPSTEGANFMEEWGAFDCDPGDEIKYRIRAFNGNGYSPYSQILSLLVEG